MIYVFDASFIGAITIPDEKNHKVDKIQSAIREEEDIFVPQLLWYEVASIYNKLIHHRRYTYKEVLQFFPRLAAIRLTTDFETGAGYSQKLLSLCGEYGLSSYDAAYLELAKRKKAALCTLDKGLYAAAKKHGVALLK